MMSSQGMLMIWLEPQDNIAPYDDLSILKPEFKWILQLCSEQHVKFAQICIIHTSVEKIANGTLGNPC